MPCWTNAGSSWLSGSNTKRLRTPPFSFTSSLSRYYREPVISRDNAFDRIRALRRLAC